jgi:hypothetical protein
VGGGGDGALTLTTVVGVGEGGSRLEHCLRVIVVGGTDEA